MESEFEGRDSKSTEEVGPAQGSINCMSVGDDFAFFDTKYGDYHVFYGRAVLEIHMSSLLI